MLTWLRYHTKTIMIVVAVLFVASMFYGLGYRGLKGEDGGSRPSSELAKVNGRQIDPVRYREILNRTAQGIGKQLSPSDFAYLDNLALGQTIDYYVILEGAQKKVKVSGREIDAALDNIMQQQKIPSKRELENALKRLGMPLSKFRDMIKDDILVQKFQMKIAEEIRVTPDDLKEVRASHILVSNEAMAKNILTQLKGGADFAALARQYSLDSSNAQKGGDLGYFTTGMMVEPFEQAAFGLKPGELSGLIKTTFGYHILKVSDSRLRQIDDQAALAQKRENAFRRWFSEAKSKAKIEIINPIFRANDLRFRGQPQAAIEEYKKAAKQNPANPIIYIYIGDTYMSMGRKDLAIQEFENAVKMEGGNPEMYLVLGKAYENLGESTLAADQFKKASLIAGDNKQLHQKLLEIFKGMKRPAEAARENAEIKRIERKEKFFSPN